MKNFIYGLTIVVMLLYSCEKEDFDDFPVTLYANTITYISDVRLFVGETKITDKEKIDKFISDAKCFQLPNDFQTMVDAIHFHSRDSTTFEVQSCGYSVQKNDKQFLFYSPFPLNSLYIVQPLIKYTGELIPTPPPYSDFSNTKEIRVGYGSYTDMEMCFVAYKITGNRANGLYAAGAWGTFLNEFNEEAVNTLQPLDTLAIMEYRVRFIAK